jgi:hypothetical protein
MRNWVPLAAAALLVTLTHPAHAERDRVSGAPVKPDKKRWTPSPITDRFAVEGMFFNPAISTSLRIDTQSPGGGLPGTTGTVVSGEKDLGLRGRVPQGRFEIMFRLRERNRLRVDYWDSSRSGNQVISRQIFFGNVTFEPNDRVTSQIDWREFSFTWTYSVFRNDRFEAGIGLSAYFLQAEARGEVVARQLRQEVSGSGAFPTIPVDFTVRIWRGLSLYGRGQYLHAAVNKFDGSINDYHGDLQYRFTPNFSLGAGYTIMKRSLDLNEAHFPGAFRFNIRGPEAFFKISF